MRGKITFGLLLLVVVLSASAGFALAQEGALGRLQPLLIDIQQQVPVEVTFVLDTTEPQTVTVPMALDLNLQIGLSSTMTPVVSVAATGPALVSVSQLLAEGQPLTDNEDIPYQIEGAEGIEIIQWRVAEDYAANFGALGELRNLDEKRDLGAVELIVSLYDSQGNLLGVNSGYMQLDTVEPGGTSPFRLLTTTPLEDVARYLVQVEARFER